MSQYWSFFLPRENKRNRVRRAKTKLYVSVPTKIAENQYKKKLLTDIEGGEYTIGELIVPQKYQKLVLDPETNGTKLETFEVQGRKIPLLDIRKELQKNTKNIYVSFHQKNMKTWVESRYSVNWIAVDFDEVTDFEALRIQWAHIVILTS